MINSTDPYPWFPSLSIAQVEAVVAATLANAVNISKSFVRVTLVILSTAWIVGLVGSGMLLVTVVRASRDGELQSLFYKLLCINCVLQSIVALGEAGRALYNSVLLFDPVLLYPYFRNFFAAIVGEIWYPLDKGVIFHVYANFFFITVDRILATHIPIQYRQWQVHKKKLIVFCVVLLHVLVAIFLVPLSFDAWFVWSEDAQRYAAHGITFWWKDKILIPLFGDSRRPIYNIAILSLTVGGTANIWILIREFLLTKNGVANT